MDEAYLLLNDKKISEVVYSIRDFFKKGKRQFNIKKNA